VGGKFPRLNTGKIDGHLSEVLELTKKI
jgi:hypothetical protein